MKARLFALVIVWLNLALPLLCVPDEAAALEVKSKDLQPVRIKGQRAMGLLHVRTDFANHKVYLNDRPYTALYRESGMLVVSNQRYIVRVVKGEVERQYELSVATNESFVLYVDLGQEQASRRGAPAEQEQQDANQEANIGYLSVSTEGDAQIFVDGVQVSASSPLSRHQVSTGSHTVRVYFIESKKFSSAREVFVARGVTMSQHFSKE